MTAINNLSLQLPIVGTVVSRDPANKTFRVQTRNGATFVVHIRGTSWFDALTNLDRLARQRLPLDRQPAVKAEGNLTVLDTNIAEGDLVAVEGILQVHDGRQRYDAMAIHLLKSSVGYYQFEHTHWWKAQIECMANKWLDVLFGDKRSYEFDDFAALYRTTLNIQGAPTDDDSQEVATLARLIYGLSSAYLLSGDERYYLAARAGVRYQREAFRSYSADGRFCFWLHARKRDRHGIYDVLPSSFGDDAGTIPLYEQIYALAGLAQYYRITNDWETLQDIRRTLDTFDAMFADHSKEGGTRQRPDGYFSHLDPVTFTWDSPELDKTGNRARKNWNSVGDHLPAYLINLVLALDPLPKAAGDDAARHHRRFEVLLDHAVEILEVTSTLIAEKFPEPGNPFVNERFDRDWAPVKDWGWQQNRAIVGHNLKIAWNLTRVANYHRAKGLQAKADALFALASRIGEDMGKLGIDQIRSGVYDALERQPSDPSLPIQFAWANTRDFWQQEQGILAYLIMAGYARCQNDEPTHAAFSGLARELSAVWNLYFLDRERNGIFFRVSDNGIPVLSSTYGDKGGHSISGYHAFELDYLAYIYQAAYLPRELREHSTFCLHFRPDPQDGIRSLNVLPDFLGPDVVEIVRVEVDGAECPLNGIHDFQIPLRAGDGGRRVMVAFRQTQAMHERLKAPIRDQRFPEKPFDSRLA